jgi:two-component system, NarL family, nitrate/nitrite response regulator NarL
MSKPRADVRILLAGHNGIFREGLKSLLEEQPGFFVVGEAIDGKEVLSLTELVAPDILLMEADSPDFTSIELLRALKSSNQNLKIVLLVSEIKKDQASEVFNAGARGIILKESATNSLFKCVNAVIDGRYWIPDKGISDVAPLQEETSQSEIKTQPPRFGLTKREMQILALVVAGRTNREIAKRISISEQTVKHHVTNIFDKVGVYNRLELALFAIHHGLTANVGRK